MAASSSRSHAVSESRASSTRIQQECPDIDDEGVTEIYSPKTEDIVADICFVHGLKGHPRKTWLYESSTSNIGFRIFKSNKQPEKAPSLCYWPFDLISRDFPKLRILVYGYDSHPSHFYKGKTNQMTISQHARNLLVQVNNTRASCRGRPIFFVAHSLGGILVKDAIIESLKHGDQPAIKDLGLSCSAIIFFSTPHLGASIAEYGLMVSNVIGSLPGGFSAYKEILRGLQPDGEKLGLVNREFFDLLNQNIPPNEKLQIYSFQEGKPLSSVKLFDGKIVPDSSSFFNRRDIERSSFISENHMDMCRFKDARTQPYRDFKAALTDYLNNSKANSVEAKEKRRREAERSAWIENLDFKDRLVRKQQLDDLQTTEASFEWIWTSPFSEWLKDNKSLFWISGKPASGKSTIMNYIAASPKTLQLLKETHDTDWKVLYFFFDFRGGKSVSNSFEGFLRSLLVQLLNHYPGSDLALPKIPGNTDMKDLSTVQYSLSQLRAAVKTIINDSSASNFVLLDGLDEYEGNKVELVSFINSICTVSNAVKICLASRPDPPFPDAFETTPTFAMQDLNSPGIRNFVLHTIQDFFSRSTKFNSSLMDKVVDYFDENSKGVFLWVRFALFDLIDGLTCGEELQSAALKRRLDQVPKELEDIYARIFSQRDSHSRRFACLVMLLIVDCEERHPELAIIREAVQTASQQDSGTQFSELDNINETYGDNNDSFRRRVLAATGGTVETYWTEYTQGFSEDMSALRFIHRSVETYLDLKGWNFLLDDQFHPSLGHETWLRVLCQKYISTSALAKYSDPDLQKEWRRLAPIQGTLRQEDQFVVDTKQLLRHQPLLNYALLFLYIHARYYEEISDSSSLRLIRPALSSNFSFFHKILSENCLCDYIHPFEDDQRAWDSGTFAIHHRLVLSASEYFSQQKDRSGSRKFNFPNMVSGFLTSKKSTNDGKMSPQNNAIVFACKELDYENGDHSRKAILKVVLEHTSGIDDIGLGLAFYMGDLSIIETVLHYRGPGKLVMRLPADFPNSLRGPTNPCRPFWVVGMRPPAPNSKPKSQITISVIEMLLKRGEDIDGICGPYGNILHSHVLANENWCDRSFVEYLLSKGVDINRKGPKGTPLACLWWHANSNSDLKDNVVWRATVRYAIKHLVKLGAVNDTPDADGSVPTVEQMKSFGLGEEYDD